MTIYTGPGAKVNLELGLPETESESLAALCQQNAEWTLSAIRENGAAHREGRKVFAYPLGNFPALAG